MGWSKADTDAYIADMNRWPGGGLGDDRKGSAHNDCALQYDQCYLDDTIQIPADAPSGAAVLRWMWYALETTQIYANCVDLQIVH